MIFAGSKIIAITDLDSEEDKANSILMAAAPKMLEALDRISDIDPQGVECAERNRFKPTGCGCIGCIARAAIRKAKGGL